MTTVSADLSAAPAVNRDPVAAGVRGGLRGLGGVNLLHEGNIYPPATCDPLDPD